MFCLINLENNSMTIARRFSKPVSAAALGALALTAALTAVLPARDVSAADWRQKYPTLNLGVITSENEADRVTRYKAVIDYFKKTLNVGIKWRTATDYAGIIEGVKAGKIEIARFGPASYAKAWIVTKGKVVPLVGEISKDGTFGYFSVALVKKDSPYKTIQDLKGKRFAFADPNSTSGHQAPRFFLGEQGIDVDKFFGQTAYSGSHENSVMALMNGTFDGVATWWRNDERSNMTRMEGKGMIPKGAWRIVWKTPRLPSSPWAMSSTLPKQMREDVRAALLAMPTADKAAWKALTDGKALKFRSVTHKDYEPVVRMIKENLKKRRAS